MSNCIFKFKTTMDKQFNAIDKPWFQYNSNSNTIRIVDNSSIPINSQMSNKLALELTDYINELFNSDSDSVGKVAYTIQNSDGYSQVEIKPTDHQWAMFELGNKDKQKSIEDKMDMEAEYALRQPMIDKESQSLANIELLRENYGTDSESGLSNTIPYGVSPTFPRSTKESIESSLKRLESPNKKAILYSNEAELNSGIESIDDNIYKDESTDVTYEENKSLIFGIERESILAIEGFENILNNLGDLNSSTSSIIESLYDAAVNSKAEIQLVELESMDSMSNLMEYDFNKNVIKIPHTTLASYNKDDIAYLLTHEIVHSVTSNALLNPQTTNEKMFSDLMHDLYNKYKELGTDHYGFTNIHEFTSEIASNKDFQEFIKSKETGLKNIWERFIDYVRTLLGLKKSNDVNKAIKAIIDISENSLSRDNIDSNHIFARKSDEDNPVKPDLSTGTKKLEFMIDSILDRLDRSIHDYNRIISRGGDSSKISQRKFRDEVKEVADAVTDLQNADKLLAISKYVDYAKDQLYRLESLVEGSKFGENDGDTNLIAMYKDLVGSYSLIPQLREFMVSMEDVGIKDLDIEDIKQLSNHLKEVDSLFDSLGTKLASGEKRLLYKELRKPQYNTEVYKRWRDDIGREYNGPKEGKEAWVAEQMETTYKDNIKADINARVTSMIENMSDDISFITAMLVSPDNTNSKLIQNLSQLLESANNDIIAANRSLDFELLDLWNEITNRVGTRIKPSELYGNIITKNTDGRHFLISEYNIEFFNEYNEHRRNVEEMSDLKPESGYTPAEIDMFNWIKDNTVTSYIKGKGSVTRPKDKWRNKNYPAEGTLDRLILDKAKEIFKRSDKQKFGIQSLIYDSFGAEFIALPTVTKSFVERSVEGQGVGIIKDMAKDFAKYRVDEVGFEQRKFDRDGKPITETRVHYRGLLEDHSQQSLDLMTLMALEGKNGNSFKVKNEVESTANLFLNIAKNKNYFQTSGDKYILNAFSKRNRYAAKPGDDSNTYKRAADMIETHLYDIFRKSMGQIAGFDTNKLIDFATSWTAYLGMGVNTIGSAVNLLNGEMHLMLETIGGHHVGTKNVAKAKAIYMRDSVNIMKDTYSPVKTSFVNQVMELFDTEGNRSMSHDHRFINSNAVRSHLNTTSIMGLQTSGEHIVQGSMTMAFLDHIKVMNGKNEYIDKDGNVVKDKDKAASMLDMLKKDDKGKVYIDENVVYTSHTPYLKINEGGKAIINRFIKKKMKDTVGNYDPKAQGMAYKTGAGRLLLLFRRYLVPMFIAKFRGINNVHKSIKDLANEDQYFSEAIQEYEIGSYTAAAKVVFKGIQNVIQEQKLSVFLSELSNMNEYQKRQARKGAMEMLTIAVILPALSGLAAAFASSNAEDDDSFLWYVAATMTRLQTEMNSFVDPATNWRILKSPTAAMGVFDNAASLTFKLFQPWNYGDKFDTGPKAGTLKIYDNVKRVTPILNRRVYNHKTKYDQIKSGTYHIFGPEK